MIHFLYLALGIEIGFLLWKSSVMAGICLAARVLL